MTRDEAKQWIPILQAYADGKVIQYLSHETWSDGNVFDFDNAVNRYRIKPEPKYRQWTEAELDFMCAKGTVLKRKTLPKHIGHLTVAGDLYAIGNSQFHTAVLAAESFFENYVIAVTGEPCGVLEGA